jgi:hypothetical protein
VESKVKYMINQEYGSTPLPQSVVGFFLLFGSFLVAMKWEMQGMAAIQFHDATTPPNVFKGVNIFQARRNLLSKWV